MKKLFSIVTAFSLMVMPVAVYSQSEQTASSSLPPVSQQLVPEGDFALKLVPALQLGTADNEAQAEDMLSSIGVAPKNGWIADYPMTPVIIGELQNAVVTAADAHKLPMERDDALKAFQALTTEFGLAIVPGSSGQYAGNQPQPSTTVINNYYYDEGPPVVTYYPPPWDYYYLYDWVSYPFWCSGFLFPGFFVLTDFSVVAFVGHHHHHHLITNHFVDPKTHAVVNVDPTTRTIGRTVHTSSTGPERFRSQESRKAATSIFDRSSARTETARGREGISSRGTRTMNRVDNIGRQNEMNVRQHQGTSFNTPNVTHERSFSTPSTRSRSFESSESSGRAFSAPSRSFNPPSTQSRGSFGGFHAQNGAHSFGQSGFSGSGGHGGCRGRC